MDEGAPLDWELRAQERARRGHMWERGRKRLVITLVVIATLAIAGGAVWAWQSDSISDRRTPTASKRSIVPATIGADVHLTCRFPLTSDDPLRMWIAGDSLAGTLGPELGQMTANTGVVAPTYDTRPSSGLSTPGFFDWPTHAREEIARIDPEVIVFIIGANDTGTGDGYGVLVGQMLDILGSEERSIVLIGSPTLRDDEKNEGAREVGEIMRDVVRLHERVTYIDAFALFGDANGDYTATLPAEDGRPLRVRTSDGIHFTPAGGRYLASHVFEILDQQCDIGEQADRAHPQEVRQSPGSGGPTGEEVPSGNGNGNGNGDGSGGTNPPATSPPPPPTPPPPPPTPPPTNPPVITVPTTPLSRIG